MGARKPLKLAIFPNSLLVSKICASKVRRTGANSQHNYLYSSIIALYSQQILSGRIKMANIEALESATNYGVLRFQVPHVVTSQSLRRWPKPCVEQLCRVLLNMSSVGLYVIICTCLQWARRQPHYFAVLLWMLDKFSQNIWNRNLLEHNDRRII